MAQDQRPGRAQRGLMSQLTPEQQAQLAAIQAGMAGGTVDDEPQVFWGYENAVDENGDPVLGRRGIESMTERLVK